MATRLKQGSGKSYLWVHPAVWDADPLAATAEFISLLERMPPMVWRHSAHANTLVCKNVWTRMHFGELTLLTIPNQVLPPHKKHLSIQY
jgi:hypothetical protein